jgi:hypothetical protein
MAKREKVTPKVELVANILVFFSCNPSTPQIQFTDMAAAKKEYDKLVAWFNKRQSGGHLVRGPATTLLIASHHDLIGAQLIAVDTANVLAVASQTSINRMMQTAQGQ